MTTRRKFIKQSGLALGAISFPQILTSCISPDGKKYDFEPGIQLYTIREAMDKNPEDALHKLAKMGYKLVETATYTGTELFYGLSAGEFSKVLNDNGLRAPSGHYAVGNKETKGTILGGWEKAIEDADKAGLNYMVCAYLSDDERSSIDAYKKRAEEFNHAGELCKKAGIQFAYHNHAFEFEELEGQTPYDILLNETDADLVKMEMDIYWVSRSGKDPVALIEKDPGRYVLWHVKDMAKTEDKNFTEVGNGVIDWPEIFSHANQSGLQHFFVEQDATPGDPFDSIQQSLDYLNDKILM